MLKEYYKREYNLVSRVWKYIALGLMGLELIVAAVLWSTYYGRGDLNELYFDLGNWLFFMGVTQ